MTCSETGSTGNLHFEIKKNIYIVAIPIVATLQIVLYVYNTCSSFI